ncbi:hypothetical protein C8Q76DRAFT_792155 [Earliella scabrosa]|nr:hypothetical protein C8Q76DRAFT_792155 [Earliella scabrosa]
MSTLYGTLASCGRARNHIVKRLFGSTADGVVAVRVRSLDVLVGLRGMPLSAPLWTWITPSNTRADEMPRVGARAILSSNVYSGARPTGSSRCA